MDLTVPLPDVLARRADGEIVVAGTRVTLYSLERHARQYGSMALLRDHFPHIPEETMREILRFCDANAAAVAAYSAAYKAELDRQYEAGHKVDLDELRGRMAARQAPAA